MHRQFLKWALKNQKEVLTPRVEGRESGIKDPSFGNIYVGNIKDLSFSVCLTLLLRSSVF